MRCLHPCIGSYITVPYPGGQRSKRKIKIKGFDIVRLFLFDF
jgi:hypothetical protein